MAGQSDFSVRKLLYNKKFTLPFSIVFAFLFWLIICINQNPVRELTIPDVSVDISTEGLAIKDDQGLDIVSGGYGEKVSVRVQGPNYILSSLSASDILVSAALDEVTGAGTYDLRLQPSRNSQKSGYTILGVSPATLKVRFDYMDTKEFVLTPQAEGISADPGLVAESPIISDQNSAAITVSGPRTDLAKISVVAAVARVNRVLAKTETLDAEVVLLDKDGNQIDKTGFTLSAETVKIMVPISRQKEVPIVATFDNAPTAYAETPIPHTLSQQTVKIIGPPATVDALTQIELAPIDFDKLSPGNRSFELAPVLPDGVKLVDNIEAVTVGVNISSYRERTFTVTNIRYRNVAAGLTTHSANSIRNVRICGPSAVIRRLTANDLYAEVDLSGKAAGEHTVTVRIKSDTHNDIWQIDSGYTVIVTLQ